MTGSKAPSLVNLNFNTCWRKGSGLYSYHRTSGERKCV